MKYKRNEIRFTTEVTLLIDLTDEQLLAQALAGEEDAFTVLYRRRQGPIYRFALHMSGSPHVAEEVTQEVFLFLLQRGQDFDAERGALGAYLFGVARNYVRRALERSYTESVLGSPVEDEAASLMVEDDPSEGIARHQTSVAVWKAVLSLPEHYREVVVLCDLQEMSYADAAEAVGCAIGTVRSRLHRAHDMLSRKLQHSAAVAPGITNVTARCLS
ncbi:MAG: RNA polymerase sigma factor [Candidatus Korobacteraceae bacterium]